MKTSTIAFAALISTLPLAAQEKTLNCDHRNNNRDMVTHCEMREQTIGFAGRLSIDGGTNGGVNVKGWDGGSVLVRSKVEATAENDGAAASAASLIRIETSAGQITASGPDRSANNKGGWSVSYEVFVPRQADLTIKTHNGGINISDVRGTIQFTATNGGVMLKRLAGDVQGTTSNGGVTVELAGTRWDGNKLDARTTNGGVNITMPENYSAHLETQTVNGHLNLQFPMTVRGEIGHNITTDIGAGGPTIHVETTNGGVNVKKAAL